MNTVAKYKLGFMVLGFFTLILLIVVVVQAGATKQDNKTYDAANKIADKLNSYVDNNYVVPASLAAAGIKDVPATVTYKKISYTKYSFCVTYKAKSTDFSAASTESDLLSSSVGSSTPSSDTSTNYDLYLDTNHHKGQNCQTVDAQIDNSSASGSGSGSTTNDPYAKCDSIIDNTAWENCVNSVTPSQGATDVNGNSTLSQ